MKIIIILVVLIFLALISAILVIALKPEKAPPLQAELQKQHVLYITKYLKIYKRYETLPVTRQHIRLCHRGLSELGIYDEFETKVQAVKLFHKSMFMVIGISFLFAIIFKDFILTLIGVLCAYLIRDIVIQKRIYTLHFRLIQETVSAVSEIRQEFIRTGDVLESLANCEPGKLVKPSINRIYSILVSETAELDLERYYNTAPLKALQTLAGISYSVNTVGDVKINGNQSNYVQGLSMIDRELNFDLNRLVLQRAKFKTLEFVPVVPLIAMPFLRIFFIHTLPATKLLYDGSFGYVSSALLLIVSTVCYKKVMAAVAPTAIKYDDRSDFDKEVIHKKIVRKIVAKIKPNDLRTLDKVQKLLKEAQSRITIDILYFRKFYFCILTFLLSMIITIASCVVGTTFAMNNYESSSIGAEPLTERELEIVKQLDELYFHLDEPIKDANDLRTFIDENTRGLSRSVKDQQLQRIRAKEVTLEVAKFRWWFIWIWFTLSLIAWFVPNIMIKMRNKQILDESQEDCLQLQTVIAVLMNTNIDTLNLLDWLSKHSRVFQPLLIDAYHRYPSNPEFSVLELKRRAGLPEFKRICDKMLLAEDLSLKESFADLESEREYLLSRRNIIQEETLMKKRTAIMPFALAPLVLVVALYFLSPVVIVGIQEGVNAMSILNQADSEGFE